MKESKLNVENEKIKEDYERYLLQLRVLVYWYPNYTKKHKPILSYNFEQNNEVKYSRVVPDTLGEAIFNDLCSMR